MTSTSPSAPGKADAAAKKKKKPVAKKPGPQKRELFGVENISVDVVDDFVEDKRIRGVMRGVQIRAFMIAILVMTYMFCANYIQPTINEYYALDSAHHRLRLVPLYMPNMTNQAVISWTTNSITEIMTFGFGDYLAHLREQRKRFTEDGWDGFVKAFQKTDVGQQFKERQLVLTTVPSDTAVIVSQGITPDHDAYEWKIQVPVVMTYATSDNITHRDHQLVVITLTRVPTSQDASGIAIKNWTLQ